MIRLVLGRKVLLDLTNYKMVENIIKTAAVGYPSELSITDAVSLLDQVLTTMQKNGLNIISTNHLGDNVFQIEYREMN